MLNNLRESSVLSIYIEGVYFTVQTVILAALVVMKVRMIGIMDLNVDLLKNVKENR